MKVVRFREVNHEAWDGLAAQSADAWLTHSSSWIEIEQRLFVSANLSFGLEREGELVGIQPLFLNEGAGMAFGERLLHSGIHRHTGLALRIDTSTSLVRAARQAAMREILLIGELYDVDRIQLNAHNLAPANRWGNREPVPFWVRDFGFQLGIAFGPAGMMPCPGASTLNADQLLDLAPELDDLFAGLHESCRNAVRQAEKAKLRFEISNDPKCLQDYTEIAKASAMRTGEALPPIDYYKAIFSSLATGGKVCIAFASQESRRIAALILLFDKKAVNYLAGVSRPDALKLRPNNFLHWNAIVWAKRNGMEVYRFGPSFPEVPREWPISRVSHFKTTFGSRSLPIIQGSLFRHPQLYTSNLSPTANHLNEIGSRPTVGVKAGGPFIAHHLQMFGFSGASATQAGKPIVLYRPDHTDVGFASSALERTACIVAVLPNVEFARAFGVTTQPRTVTSPQVLHARSAGSKPWKRLRTLHSFMRFAADADATAIVQDSQQEPIWLHREIGKAGSIVFIGTDLASDLLRYRQGDPAAAAKRPTEPIWGIPGERPNYLFQAQLAQEDLRERPADWWCEALADALEKLCSQARSPMLPNGAPGAIVVTGDDDQASLHRYSQQRDALGALPITYFLHPLTKHNKASLKRLEAGRRIELGLHPDALDEPDRYKELFSEQARWFRRLTGENTRTVRNHGFLNDGYWGHVATWNDHGVEGSSNLPGLDGSIINGSLLPARLVLDDELTQHWSILTAIGDGIVFVHAWDDAQSAGCVLELADRIRDSGVPGVIVINLHPENIEKTRGMHEAVVKVVQDGFVSWTMSECFEWFGRGEQRNTLAVRAHRKRYALSEKFRKILRLN